MKNHAYRPLIVVIVFVALILAARAMMVPDDFGTHEQGYRFGWHRLGNEQEWKDFKSKYMERDYCNDCHPDKVETLAGSPHKIISCQNCHTAEGVVAADHPDTTEKMDIDRSRLQCLRCHARLPDVKSGRDLIKKQINNDEHNKGIECADCHNPHSPGFE